MKSEPVLASVTAAAVLAVGLAHPHVLNPEDLRTAMARPVDHRHADDMKREPISTARANPVQREVRPQGVLDDSDNYPNPGMYPTLAPDPHQWQPWGED